MPAELVPRFYLHAHHGLLVSFKPQALINTLNRSASLILLATTEPRIEVHDDEREDNLQPLVGGRLRLQSRCSRKSVLCAMSAIRHSFSQTSQQREE